MARVLAEPVRALPAVDLWPIDTADRMGLVTRWLCGQACHWIDLGENQRLTPSALKMLVHRFDQDFRLFGPSESGLAVGVVALTNINVGFKTGMVWGMLGDKQWTRQGLTTAAISRMLGVAFGEVGLHAVSTWALDQTPTMSMIARLHFHFVGRQRASHYVHGQAYDRIWFDLLAGEFARTAQEPSRPRARVLHQ